MWRIIDYLTLHIHLESKDFYYYLFRVSGDKPGLEYQRHYYSEMSSGLTDREQRL
jgi:hypothetical protein